MNDLNLTTNFSLRELTRSDSASRLGLANVPNEEQVKNLKNLCEMVLQPLRDHVRVPVMVNSGFRSEAVNKAVGGVWNSQHLTGEAADIRASNWNFKSKTQKLETIIQWACWIMEHCPYDQLIIEDNGSDVWIHVSCKLNSNENRYLINTIIKRN